MCLVVGSDLNLSIRDNKENFLNYQGGNIYSNNTWNFALFIEFTFLAEWNQSINNKPWINVSRVLNLTILTIFTICD